MLGQAFDDVLLAAQAGAGWAFARLHEDLAGTVTGYLRRQGAAEPDDLASETFLHVFRGIRAFEGHEQGFRSWVFTIAHRRLTDERRRRGRQPAMTSMDEHDWLDDLVGTEPSQTATEEVADLLPYLEVLTDPQRDVILLRVIAGLSVEETAVAVDRSPDAVRQLQHRGLRAIEDRLVTNGTASVGR